MHNMEYNTSAKRLTLPEYGRNVQNMVDYCLTIDDRATRNNCAGAIISVMGNLFPHLRDVNDFKHILWDHLAIMSGFQLDVDYPYEIIKPENMYKRPPRVEYSENRIRYRHYGRMMERMIQKIATLQEGEEKETLIRVIGNQMKKSYLMWNKDSVDNQKIFKDLAELSNGYIIRNEGQIRLADASALIEIVPPKNNKNNNANNKNKNKNKNRQQQRK